MTAQPARTVLEAPPGARCPPSPHTEPVEAGAPFRAGRARGSPDLAGGKPTPAGAASPQPAAGAEKQSRDSPLTALQIRHEASPPSPSSGAAAGEGSGRRRAEVAAAAAAEASEAGHCALCPALEVQEVEESIEEMLIRLDEFCSMIDMIRNGTSQLLDEAVPLIKAKMIEMHSISMKVDKLEAFFKMVGQHASFLEEQVFQAEKAHAVITHTVGKLFGSAAISLFKCEFFTA
ncbi:breast carcinoma-amplified sequence 4 [Paroedura picta]|uniref:breast carcinoma-amplified sequence 4 n=1 Tax=Paroedura picta TaxID=143630 RepID=UPI0040572410